MNKTKDNVWVDIRRYEWTRDGIKFYDQKQVSEAIISLGGLEVNIIPIRYDITLGFYVFPENVGVEFSFYEDSHFNFVRSMVKGRGKQEVTSVQKALEEIIKTRGYTIYAKHAANPKSDLHQFLGKAYGSLTGLGLRF